MLAVGAPKFASVQVVRCLSDNRRYALYLPHELHTLTNQAKAAAQELRAAALGTDPGCRRVSAAAS